MSGTAVAIMILVGGFVWGGFITLALKAVRSESGKRRARAALADAAAGPVESAGAGRGDEASGG